nr:CPBP family intramembrane metalloprotease [Escherichia coli]
MQQQSAAFHAAGAAFVGSNIRKVMYAYIRDNDEIFLVGLITSAARIRSGGLLLPILLHMEATVLG